MFMNQQLTPEQRLVKATVAVMGHERYMALAGILMIGTRAAVDSIPDFPPDKHQTAATNGRDEWYCNAFVETLSDAELRGLIIHENYHKMYRHLITWQNLHDIDTECCAKACDYMINIRIYDDNLDDNFAKLPDGGLLDVQYRGLNVAQIFQILRQEKQGGGQGQGQGQGQGGGQGQPQQGQGQLDHHDMKGANQLTEAEKVEMAKDIDEAIRQGALLAGKAGSGGLRDIDELMKPQVDWRQVLRDFLYTTCAGHDYSTWRLPSKRYIAGGMYMPRGVAETVGELCIEIDMSGSTWGIVKYFMGEMKGIIEQVRPDLVRVIYWDTKVCREEKYTMDELDGLLNLTKPSGGGGTVVSCVPDYCNEFGIKPQAHIVLTDGYLGGDWGVGWNAPVLWVICDNEKDKPTNGKYVNISSTELR